MKTSARLAGAVILSSLLSTSSVQADDDEIRFEDLPTAVRETAEREIGDGLVLEVEVDTKRGATVYEVEFVQDAVEYELDIAADGTLLRRERD